MAESTLEIPKTERYTCQMSSQLLMSGPKILKRLLLLLEMLSSEILMPIEERNESNEVCQGPTLLSDNIEILCDN